MRQYRWPLLIPAALILAAAAGRFNGPLFGRPDVREGDAVSSLARSTAWQKVMAKRCLLGDGAACRLVKATRPDIY